MKTCKSTDCTRLAGTACKYCHGDYCGTCCWNQFTSEQRKE